MGQDFLEHKWKHRILLILVAEESDSLSKQISQFKIAKDGLNERKIQVYASSPGQLRKGLEQDVIDQPGDVYKKYKQDDSHFEMILIGLDGGIKHRYMSPVSTHEIFALIDGMPMRQAELRRKGNDF